MRPPGIRDTGPLPARVCRRPPDTRDTGIRPARSAEVGDAEEGGEKDAGLKPDNPNTEGGEKKAFLKAF